MKHIYITFEDEEFIEIKKEKGETSWHDFIKFAGRKNARAKR
jgi:hypothetical protein